jgi:calcineurin-like phosphoesterase family protein
MTQISLSKDVTDFAPAEYSGKTWVASDPHFGHANICKFTNADGSKMRPWENVDEMNEALIDNWNGVVSDKDRVYLLGDVAFKASVMKEIIPRLRGRICLVPGNHEPTKMRKYFHLFDDVRGYVQKKSFVMSHVPLHPDSLTRWGINIHGHLHHNQVRLSDGSIDPRYFCACVERTNYRPMELTQILEYCKKRNDDLTC